MGSGAGMSPRAGNMFPESFVLKSMAFESAFGEFPQNKVDSNVYECHVSNMRKYA